jgi:Plasmid pRiA4b ORF-3-like protein
LNLQESHKSSHKRPNYLLHIQLCPDDIDDPPIIRTLSCPASATFETLHKAIQIAFGWASTHTYDFVVKDPTYDLELDQPDAETVIKRLMSRQQAQRGGPAPDPGMRQFILRIVEKQPEGPMAMFGAVDRMHVYHRQHPNTIEKLSYQMRLHTIFEDPAYNGHEIGYCYDFGDSWNHAIRVIGRPDTTDWVWCTGGEGHGCAEDAGSTPGWNALKEAYAASRPNKEQKEKMEWFETKASNRDPRGLRGNRVREWDMTEVNDFLSDL